MQEGWRTEKLTDILTDEQIARVAEYLKANDTEGLRSYLNTLNEQLEGKEVLPDYLYYSLLYGLGVCNQ